MVSVLGRDFPKWAVALITASIIAGSVLALELLGVYRISYIIEPASESPTLSPNPITLDLGVISSGSTGSKDFEDTATLSLPYKYEITFELDDTTIDDFNDFSVDIEIYEAGTSNRVGFVMLYDGFMERQEMLDAGDYDLDVHIEYTAKSVTTPTNGDIVINLQWPE